MLAPCWRRITFGCAALDRVTGGGLSIRGLTEIAGESGCGKSQLCLQLSLCVQLPTSSGGADKSAVYICTEDAFPSRRLSQLAKLYRSRHGISDWMDKIFIEQLCDAVGFESFAMGPAACRRNELSADDVTDLPPTNPPPSIETIDRVRGEAAANADGNACDWCDYHRLDCGHFSAGDQRHYTCR